MKKILALFAALLLTVSTGAAIDFGDLLSFGGDTTTSSVSAPGLDSGNYLIVDIDRDEARIHGFELMEDFPENSNFEDNDLSTPMIMIRDRSSGNYGKYSVAQGFVNERDGSLSDFGAGGVASCLTGNCQGGLNEAYYEGYTPTYRVGCSSGNFDCSVNKNPSMDASLAYEPQGEMIAAATRGSLNDYENPEISSNLQIHLCNNERINAGTEESVVYALSGGDLKGYKCEYTGGSTTSYKWQQMDECRDGVDNDGDGRLDHQTSQFTSATNNDPGCDSLGDTETTTERGCERIIENENNEKVYQSGVENDGSCEYGTSDDESYSFKYSESNAVDFEGTADGNFPHEFECEQDSTNDHLEFDDRKEFCNSLPSTSDYWGPHQTMKTVAYKIPESRIPTTSDSETVKNYVKHGSFISYFDNIRYQTLRGAEFRYTGSGHHNTDYYENNDFVTGGDDYGPGEMDEEWDVANAGQIDGSGGGTLTDANVFTGGFYGSCEEPLKWVYTQGEWICGTGNSGSETAEIEFFNIVPGQVGGYAGFYVPIDSLYAWSNSHSQVPLAGGDADPLKVRAQCWRGNAEQRPSDSQKRVNLEGTAPITTTGGGGRVYQHGLLVSGYLPERTNLDTSSYTCIYGFQQKVDPFEAPPSSNVKMYMNGDIVWNQDTGTGPVDGFSQGEAYITEGVNDHQHSKIKTTVTGVSTIEGMNDARITQSLLSQQDHVTELPHDTDPFQQFSTGSQLNPEPRHPLEFHDKEYSWDFGSNGE